MFKLCVWSISYVQYAKLGSSLEMDMNCSNMGTGIKVCKLLCEASFPVIQGI